MSSGDGAARRSFYELFQGSLVGYVTSASCCSGWRFPCSCSLASPCRTAY